MTAAPRKGPAPGFGPFRAWALAGAGAILVFGACSAPARVETGGPPSPVPESADSVVVDTDDDSPEGLLLADLETAWLNGEYRAVAASTDSLAGAWQRRPELGSGPVRRLVRLLLAGAEDELAVDQLLFHPSALDDDWRAELRAAVRRLSLDELDRLGRRQTRDEKARGTVRAEHARALVLAGRGPDGRELARSLENADLDGPDERIVEDILAGRVTSPRPGIRLGFVVPRSGGFSSVGDQLLEGGRLAARRFEQESGIPVELVVLDESAAGDSTGFGIARLDTSRLAGIVGPVRSEALQSAARARGIPGLAIVSPTAAEDSAVALHAYSLWDRAQRDTAVATAVGEWMVSAFRPGRVAALYPAGESGLRRAEVFRTIAEAGGFRWVGGEAYEADSTTHEAQIRALTAADPDIVFVVADGTRQVLQVAPQLHFYGLRGRITLVSQDWTHPTVARRLDPAFSDYRVAGVYFEREQNDEWRWFAEAWDEAYRRSLPENAFAALGYDAVNVLLRSIPDPALVRPAAVARSVERLDGLQGVTGRFSFDPESRRLTRSTRVRMILGGELVDPDVQAIEDWSLETLGQEEQRLRRDAAEGRRRSGSF